MGFLQVLAILFAMIGVLGVALTVRALTAGQRSLIWMGLAIIGFVFAAGFGVASTLVLEVGVTEIAVIYNTLTGELESPKGPGLYVIGPYRTVTRYPKNQLEYTLTSAEDEGARAGNDQVTVRSVDGQTVFMDATIHYQIPMDNANRIHQDWNTVSYEESFIRPTVQSVVRDVVSGYQAEEIYGVKRNDLQVEIEAELKTRFADRGFELTEFLMRNVRFSTEFMQAIEDKQIEEQKLEQAQTAAQRREAEAKGNANAVIETARGDAEARLVQARAEAEGLRLISDQLAANPNLLQYIYIQSLAPDIKLALIPSNSPFLFDSSTFTNLAPDFVAPAVATVEPSGDGE